jgi:hypothetical protein
VPAFAPCTAPDRAHGAPLAYGSCSAPTPTSANVTVGTPDANGKLPNARAFLQVDPRVGTPGGPDDTDVSIAAKLTSVYRTSDLSDYAGALEARLTIRRTDKDAGVSSTSLDFPLSATVPCAATADPDFGSTCALVTSTDTLVPGSAPEGRRTLWALGPVGVYDAGADGDAGTTGDNRLFEAQGVFVP